MIRPTGMKGSIQCWWDIKLQNKLQPSISHITCSLNSKWGFIWFRDPAITHHWWWTRLEHWWNSDQTATIKKGGVWEGKAEHWQSTEESKGDLWLKASTRGITSWNWSATRKHCSKAEKRRQDGSSLARTIHNQCESGKGCVWAEECWWRGSIEKSQHQLTEEIQPKTASKERKSRYNTRKLSCCLEEKDRSRLDQHLWRLLSHHGGQGCYSHW